MSERLAQTQVAEAQIEQGAAGGLKAEWEDPNYGPTSEVESDAKAED